MEENQCYELFENLLQQILLNKPDRPLDFIIEKLQQEPGKFLVPLFDPFLLLVKRVFLMGPPGSFRQENAAFIADQFGWKCITTGELLRKEVSKKTETGKKVQEAFSAFQYGKLNNSRRYAFYSLR